MKPRAFLFAGTLLCAASLLLRDANHAAHASPNLVVVRADTQESVTRAVIARSSGGAGDIVISQKDKAFAPGSVEVKVGQTIEIHNDDATVHNAYCQTGEFKYNSGPQQPGTRSRLTFATPGVYEVRCAIHPKMKLAVTVTE
ncbi:MAG TPA: cupredoxin domain-containing protein [Opitutaceae bacterium]|nr:cupredoxin domain-containing protein [Opitutaceae bacterium]